MTLIINGDCLEELRGMPDNSVDAVITDPPYGLSNTTPTQVAETIAAWVTGDREHVPSTPRKGRKNCLAHLIGLGKFDALNPDPLSGKDGVNLSVTLDPALVPVLRSIKLDDETVLGEVEVHDVSPDLALDDVLVDDLFANFGEGNQDVQFRLGAGKGVACCVGKCSCFGELTHSRVSVGVRIGYYTLADTEGASPVVALRTTEVRAVLTFDVRRATFELTPASAAIDDYLVTLLVCPKLVGAGAGASGLTAMPETGGVGGVLGVANGALSLDLLTHVDLLDRFSRPNSTPVGFMGQEWDSFVPSVAVWDECFRVLKPGGHMAVFSGTRTIGLMDMSIRLAGFDHRDTIGAGLMAWVTGQGFPKSQDVSKQIDKLDAAEERRNRALEFTAWMRSTGITSAQVDGITGTNMGGHFLTPASQPAVATADLFDMLRPHLPEVPERIEHLVAQRTVESQNFKAREVTGIREVPKGHAFAGSTYGGDSSNREYADTAPATDEARKWSGWGTQLKPSWEPILLYRKPLSERTVAANVLTWGTGAINVDATRIGTTEAQGRFPANVVLDRDNADRLDQQTGILPGGTSHKATHKHESVSSWSKPSMDFEGYADKGGASRFFHVAENLEHLDAPFKYCAKAPKKERPSYVDDGGATVQHATVKPLTVMRWLVRLLTPPGGVVLDPFAGSGTTVEAALLEGFTPIGIEAHTPYIPLIHQRVARATATPDTLPIGDAA